METKITATELARDLSNVLNRVRYQGETFRVERNGEAVAVILPVRSRPATTLRELGFRLRNLRMPEGFADDLEEIIKNQPPMPESPWPSS